MTLLWLEISIHFWFSHIVFHLMRSGHKEVSILKAIESGDKMLLKCATCDCHNVFELGYIRSRMNGPLILTCRSNCLDDLAQ